MKNKNSKIVTVDPDKFVSDESVFDLLIDVDCILEEIRYRRINVKEGHKKLYQKLFSDN